MPTDITGQLRALARALEDFTQPVSPLEPTSDTTAHVVDLPSRTRRGLLLGAASVTLLAGTITGTWWLTTRHDAAGPTAPAPSASVGALMIVAATPTNLGDGAGRNGDLYLLTPNQRPRRVVGEPTDGIAQQCPQLSHDGHHLAWGEATATGPMTTFRGVWPVVHRAMVVAPISASGAVGHPTVRVPIPDGNGEMPCPKWAPDGSAVAYRVNGDVWITRMANHRTTVVKAAGQPWRMANLAWSNDSSRIAASESGDVRIIDVADDTSHPLSLARMINPMNLAWLPGDRQVLFATDLGGDLQVAPIDGSHDPSSIVSALLSDKSRGHDFTSLALSPHGDRVAVVHTATTCTAAGCSGSSELLVIDLSTLASTPVTLPIDRPPSTVRWSPDGLRLLLSDIDGVISVPADGRGPATTYVQLSDGLDLEWSHDEITWEALR